MVSRNVSTARLFGFFSDGAKPCVRPDVSAVLLSESSRRETVLLLKRTDLHIASVFSLSRHKTERLPEIDKDRVGCSIPALFLMWRKKIHPCVGSEVDLISSSRQSCAGL